MRLVIQMSLQGFFVFHFHLYVIPGVSLKIVCRKSYHVIISSVCDVLDTHVQCKQEQLQRVHFSTTQCKGGKKVAPTYLFWSLDSKKICHDLVYCDLIFIVCISLERPGGQFRLKGESCIMFNIVTTKSDFLKFRFGWGLQLGTPSPHPWVHPCMRHCYECWKTRGMVDVYIILFISWSFCCACAVGTVA
jgi:hypothetical protein